MGCLIALLLLAFVFRGLVFAAIGAFFSLLISALLFVLQLGVSAFIIMFVVSLFLFLLGGGG